MRSFVLRSTFTARKDGSFFIVFFASWISEHAKDLSGLYQWSHRCYFFSDRGLIGVDFATIRTVRWTSMWSTRNDIMKRCQCFFWQMKKVSPSEHVIFWQKKSKIQWQRSIFQQLRNPPWRPGECFGKIFSKKSVPAKKSKRERRNPTPKRHGDVVSSESIGSDSNPGCTFGDKS